MRNQQTPAFIPSAASVHSASIANELSSTQWQPTRKQWLSWLSAVALVALVARGAVLWQRTPFVPVADEKEYIALARQMAETGTFSNPQWGIYSAFHRGPGQPTAFRAPALPFLLSVQYRVFGFTELPHRIAMILLSAIGCVFIALIGRELLSPAAGLVAAFAWALWPPGVFGPYAADRISAEGWGVFFLLTHFALLCCFLRRPTLPLAFVTGVALGVAVLSRGYLFFLLPLLVIYICRLPRPVRQNLVPAAVLSVGACLIIGSWVTRNWIVMGKPLLSTQTEAFYLGNNEWARGSLNGDVFVLADKAPQVMVVKKKYPNFWRMSEVQLSRMWMREAVRCVVTKPSHFIWLLGRKALIFAGPFQDWSVGFYRWHYAFVVVLLLAPIGLANMIRARRTQELWLLLLPVAAVFAAALLTYAHDRYRYTVEPFMVLLAAQGAVYCCLWLRHKLNKGRVALPLSSA